MVSEEAVRKWNPMLNHHGLALVIGKAVEGEIAVHPPPKV